MFTVPGDGCVDYPPIMQLLKAQDYHGWLVVEAEQDPAIAHPLTYARMGYNNLSRGARRRAYLRRRHVTSVITLATAER